MFRPCIDLHKGRVKQIVGSTLGNGGEPVTNFETDRPASWYADLYRRDGLGGGHVILLGPGNESAAHEALAAFPGGMQVGGGVRPDNAAGWLEAGASHVIVTSWVFREGRIDWKRLEEMVAAVGRDRLVIDLSCRRRNGTYWVVTDRWRNFTQTRVCRETLEQLAEFASEFLIHAADVEGKMEGVDWDLVGLLAETSPLTAVYAGGANSLDDMRLVWEIGQGRIHLTIGSALDIFGGTLPYRDVVALHRKIMGIPDGRK